MILENCIETLKKILKDSEKIVVCGVGNELKSDDRIGILIAEELKNKINSEKISVFICGSAPEGFSGKILKEKPSHLVIIDAARFNGNPGDIGLFKPDEIEGIITSTHTLPLSLMCKYLFSELQGDIEIIIIGIQIENLEFGEEISPKVLKAKDKILRFFLELSHQA